MSVGRVGAVLVALTALASSAEAQRPELRGYGMALGLAVGESELARAGLSNFERLRGMLSWESGTLSLEGAYEHTLTLREAGASGAALITAGGITSNGDWADLGGTIEERATLVWLHRVDRLLLGLDLGSGAELLVGRQPVSWATTLVFTPADPFSPFDPSDPFREYRQGVDALRLRIYPGPVSEVDVVVRRSDFGFQATTTAAVRASTSRRGWDVSAWAGIVHDRAAVAAALSGSIGTWALRAEASLRDYRDHGATLRSAIGADRRFALGGRDLFVVLEYLRDGLGVRRPGEIQALARSDAARRGELQALGRDEVAFQASYQAHPLVGMSGLVLLNPRDGSLLVAPSASYSASASVSVAAGLFLGLGEDALDTVGGPLSEYGIVPGVAYLAVSWFM